MQQALADFRIESDQVVYLAFADGRSYRVSPGDLEQFLQQDDLRRVQRALRLRGQFMRRILPPTAALLVVVGIIGLGSYDMNQMSRSWSSPSSVHSQPYLQKAASTSPPAAATSTTAAAGATPTVQLSGTSVGASVSSAPVPMSSPSAVYRAAPVSSQQSAIKLAAPLPLDGEPLRAQPAPQILAPITTPVGGVVKQLTKLLP